MSSHDDQATTTTTDDMIISPIPTVGNLIHGNASVPLAISQDTDWGLSDLDILVRNNLEVFQASEDDVLSAHLDGKFPIKCGQIGVRCIHCARNNVEGARRGAVMYPYSLNSLFESTRILQIMHLEQCSHVPDDLKKKISSFKRSLFSMGTMALASSLRRYYTVSAKSLGLFDKDNEDGIFVGEKPEIMVEVPKATNHVNPFDSYNHCAARSSYCRERMMSTSLIDPISPISVISFEISSSACTIEEVPENEIETSNSHTTGSQALVVV